MPTKDSEKKDFSDISEFFGNTKAKNISIFCHDDPDPDCMASAMAMAEIAIKYKIKPTVYYGGEISHTQNKAMINVLDISMVKINDLDGNQIEKHKEFVNDNIIALVDTTCFMAGNCYSPKKLLSEDKRPEIIIDHHNSTDIIIDIPVHINKKVGACSSIFVEILKELKIKIDKRLGTALYLGIMKDTDELNAKHVLTDIDYSSVDFLKDKMDFDLYLRIINCPKPKILIELMGLAKNKYIKWGGDCVVSGIGILKPSHRSLIAEICDDFMCHDQVKKCVVLGIVDEGIGGKKYLAASFRNTGDVVDANEFVKRIFGKESGGKKGAGGAFILLGESFDFIIDSASDSQEKIGSLFSLIFESYANKILDEIEI